ncbi:MAG TPA: nuclear transport factor 2 family protein [Nonomuraea sp.]|nr:nuclear transport factor 2 family protein [Nonomuraea sp.]
MAEHPHITVAGGFYDALAKGDMDHLREELLADDVVFHVPGRGPMARDYVGKDQVLGYLARVGQATAGTLRMEPQAFLVGDDLVAVVVRNHAERDGRAFDDHGMQLFKIANGRISERSSYPADAYAVDEFFS